jgi:hypothetical protein
MRTNEGGQVATSVTMAMMDSLDMVGMVDMVSDW